MKGTIVLIDDDTAERMVAADRLAAAGFDVRDAADGQRGVQLACQRVPDVIVCDLLMPGWDGYRVLSEVRSQPGLAAVRFIFLTALGQVDDVRRGMNRGVDDYLVKPISGADLVSAVEAQMEKARRQRERVTQEIAESMRGLGAMLKGWHAPSIESPGRPTPETPPAGSAVPREWKPVIEAVQPLLEGTRPQAIAWADLPLKSDAPTAEPGVRERESVPVDSLRMIVADREYTSVFLSNGRTAHVRKSLSTWERELPAGAFVRIHRGRIVRIANIKRVIREGRRVSVHVEGFDRPLPVSYRLVPAFFQALHSAEPTRKGNQGT